MIRVARAGQVRDLKSIKHHVVAMYSAMVRYREAISDSQVCDSRLNLMGLGGYGRV